MGGWVGPEARRRPAGSRGCLGHNSSKHVQHRGLALLSMCSVSIACWADCLQRMTRRRGCAAARAGLLGDAEALVCRRARARLLIPLWSGATEDAGAAAAAQAPPSRSLLQAEGKHSKAVIRWAAEQQACFCVHIHMHLPPPGLNPNTPPCIAHSCKCRRYNKHSVATQPTHANPHLKPMS